MLKSVGASTTNTRLNSIGHLWTWAQGQGFVSDEQRCPITGLTINARVQKKEKVERKPFTDAHLSLILTHPNDRGPIHSSYHIRLDRCLTTDHRRSSAGEEGVVRCATGQCSIWCGHGFCDSVAPRFEEGQ